MYFAIKEKTLILWYLSTVSPRELRFPRTQFLHLFLGGAGGRERGGEGESGENNNYSYKILKVPK